MESKEARTRRLRIYAILAVLGLITVGLVAFRLRPNTRPVFADPGPALTVEVAEDVNLTAMFHDPDADVHTVRWQFGDGKTGEGVDVTAAWDQPGKYFVLATVDDHRGGVDSWDAPLSVTVLPIAPAAPRNKNLTAEAAYAEFDASVPATTTGSDIAFSGLASGLWRWTPNGSGGGNWSAETDPTVIDGWHWDFGDGETFENETITGAAATHSYLAAGLYFVKLTASIQDDPATPTIDETSSASWGVTVRILE